MRYKILLSYNGSDFCGWQIQPHDPSVQQTLEEALSKLLGEAIGVTGAGRTDTEVNAVGYTAHFESVAGIDCARLRYKLNAILPESITVHSVEKAAADFHARFGATDREYTYFLHTMKDPFAASFSYLYTFPLDFEAMNRAAALLVGTHDFSCFEKAGADNRTSVCTVSQAYWKGYLPTHAHLMHFDPGGGGWWYFRINADRFLRNMVRATVGTLLEVGRGKRTVEEFAALILPPSDIRCDTSRRSLAGESVPGKALFLSGIDY